MSINQIVDLSPEQLERMLNAQETESEKGVSIQDLMKEDSDATYFEEHITLDDQMMTSIVQSDAFERGVQEAAEVAGFFTTLINFGMAVEFAEAMIQLKFASTEEAKMTKAVLEYQVQAAKESHETQKALMKEKSAQMESSQI